MTFLRKFQVLTCCVIFSLLRIVSGEERLLEEPVWFPVEKLIVDSEQIPFVVLTDPKDQRSKSTIKRYHCAVVRGVFPLGKQIRQLAQDLQVDEKHVKRMLDLVDFRLEREEAGQDGHIDKPRLIDVQSLAQIYAGLPGFSDEIVPEDFVNAVITCPLPVRSKGNWAKFGSHPELEQAKAGDYLLFRYIDTTVQPEKSYRYSVEFKFENPNRQREEAHPFLRNGDTRSTPWSRPTKPVRINKPDASKK